MSLTFWRSALFSIPVVAVLTVGLEIISLLASLVDHRGEWQHRIARLWARLMLPLCFVKVQAEGLEKIDNRCSYIYVCNHTSYMDIPVLMSEIPQQFRFFAKVELLKNPLWGIHLKRAGHVFVDRSNARASFRSMADGIKLLKEDGVSVLLFPEGSRSPEGVRKFEEGAAYMAIKAGVTVIPIAVVGTRKILPIRSLDIRGGTATLRIGEPITTGNLTQADRMGLTLRLHDEVSRLVDYS